MAYLRDGRIFAVIAVLAVAGFGAYQYYERSALSERLTSLESNVAALATVLQQSDNLSDEDRERLSAILSGGDAVLVSAGEPLTDIVASATPAVVSIVVSRDVPLLDIEYVNPFGDDPRYRDVRYRVPILREVGTTEERVGAGTGFFIRPDGYILTNRHVVEDTEAGYTVFLSSGERKEARVLYRDEANDAAVLKIDGDGYATLPLGDSTQLKLGQSVVAIGNALGEYDNTVSVGIISGLDRTIEAYDGRGGFDELSGVIQTDAAINRGNSGGPLLDPAGNVIGVNVAMEREASNIAFAIPIDDIKGTIDRVVP